MKKPFFEIRNANVWRGDVLALRDSDGKAFGDELTRIGWRGDADPAGLADLAAYFELHIEQGPILEREGKQIGVVTGAQAQVWYDAVIIGQDSHAGTTPPSARRDALVAAARVIERVDALMRARGEEPIVPHGQAR